MNGSNILSWYKIFGIWEEAREYLEGDRNHIPNENIKISWKHSTLRITKNKTTKSNCECHVEIFFDTISIIYKLFIAKRCLPFVTPQ